MKTGSKRKSQRKTKRKTTQKHPVSQATPQKVDNTEGLIKLCKKIMTLCNTLPYSEMKPEDRYQSLFETNKIFAQSHPVVYKMIVEEKKYSTEAFKKYLSKYNKAIITPDQQPALGSYYLMYLEMSRNKRKHNMKDLYRYKADCEQQMKNDLVRVKTIEKEESELYDKKEMERLETNKQELFEFFSKLKELQQKTDEFKAKFNNDNDDNKVAASSK